MDYNSVVGCLVLVIRLLRWCIVDWAWKAGDIGGGYDNRVVVLFVTFGSGRFYRDGFHYSVYLESLQSTCSLRVPDRYY